MLLKGLVALISIPTVLGQVLWYPSTQKDELKSPLVPFEIGTPLPLECMSRNIDNGEHAFDLAGNIVFTGFPECRETGKPLTLNYGVNEDLTCTVAFTDELFHLFQLYLHEDAPFSCRLPISNSADAAEKGLSVPLVMNIRGTLSDSHIHIDNHINILNVTPRGFNGLISSVGFSSGTNVTRVIIGDMLPLNFAVRWLGVDSNNKFDEGYHYQSGFYRLPVQWTQSLGGIIFYVLTSAIISALVTYGVIYTRFNTKKLLNPAYDYDVMSKSD